MIMYLICVGICLTVIVVALIISAIFILKAKNKNTELENEKLTLEVEKSKFVYEQNQLKKEQEDLKNAQILFQKEKEAKGDLSNKTEKEVAIDLFIKFMEMESTFDYMKNNLASIDSKLVGVKNYSEDLVSLKNELTMHLNSLKNEMIDMQKSYSTTLYAMHNDLKISLSNIECRIEGIVSSITGKEMNNLVQAVNSELEQMKNIVALRIAEFSGTMDKRIANLASEFRTEIKNNMPNTIDEDDIEYAIRNVLSEYTISSLDTYDVENAVSNAVNNAFPYSFDFEDGVKNAIHSEITSELSDIKSEMSELGYKIGNITTLIESKR